VDPAKARVTVEEWSQVWLATKAHLRPRTREKYESALRVWVLPRWGRVALADITHADLVRWVAEIQVGRSPAHTRHTLIVMSQMLKLAVRDGRLSRNVADGVAKPRLTRPVQRFLSNEEVARLAAELPEPYDLLVVLLAFTGLRFGEAAGLQVGDVDLERGPRHRQLEHQRALARRPAPRRPQDLPAPRRPDPGLPRRPPARLREG
jgi:integrase